MDNNETINLDINRRQRRRQKTTKMQYTMFVNFMQENLEWRNRKILNQRYHELADKLNSVEFGPTKNSIEWRKVFSDWKFVLYNKVRSQTEKLTKFENRAIFLFRKIDKIRLAICKNDNYNYSNIYLDNITRDNTDNTIIRANNNSNNNNNFSIEINNDMIKENSINLNSVQGLSECNNYEEFENMPENEMINNEFNSFNNVNNDVHDNIINNNNLHINYIPQNIDDDNPSINNKQNNDDVPCIADKVATNICDNYINIDDRHSNISDNGSNIDVLNIDSNVTTNISDNVISIDNASNISDNDTIIDDVSNVDDNASTIVCDTDTNNRNNKLNVNNETKGNLYSEQQNNYNNSTFNNNDKNNNNNSINAEQNIPYNNIKNSTIPIKESMNLKERKIIALEKLADAHTRIANCIETFLINFQSR